MFTDEYNRLHFDLSFLEPGNHWMPRDDTRRMEKYEFAREEFELTPEDMVEQLFPRGLMNFANWGDFAHFVKLLAYPRLLTLKTADMVIGEPPLVTAQSVEKTTKQNKKSEEISEQIKDIVNMSQFFSHFKKALFDYSRFGVLLLRVYKCEISNHALVTAWNPKEWIPVYENDGTYRIKYNVIGWYECPTVLKVQIHNNANGEYEERTLITDGAGNIVCQKGPSKWYNRHTGKRLFFAVANTPTTTNPLGTSDYEIINRLLQKAIERLTAILRVLDEHADPSMTGPSSLLEKDHEKGELVFKTSKYYAVNGDEKEPKYLTWEANLDSSFKAFETLMEQIYTLSEMGTAFLGVAKSTGNAVSGTAMRFKMISPLAKARRIANDLSQPLKEVISSMLFIEGTKIESKDINVAWRDSLPKDPRELAELTKCEAGSTAVKPLINAIMDNYNIDEATAEEYVQTILEEQQTFAELRRSGNNSDDDTQNNRTKGSVLDPANDQNKGGADNPLKK